MRNSMNNTKKLIILLLFIFCLPSLGFAGTRRVEGKTLGSYYNNSLEAWYIYPIIVYVNDKGFTYIKGGEGLLAAEVHFSDGVRQKIINSLKKSTEWVEIAKKEQLEVTKDLCNVSGIWLKFFAANKGQQTDVILFILNEPFNSMSFYLNPEQVLSLIALLEKVPGTLKELHEENERANKLLGNDTGKDSVNISNLKLIGISMSDNPDAMIEDTATMKTYFCKNGDRVGEYTVEKINKSSVTLKKENSSFELNSN